MKSASRVKSAKPVVVEIPAEFLSDFVFLTENAPFPKAFPSEGKVAEAAQRAVKTDEVEWQLTLNDVRFAHDACLAANDARLRRMMRANGALRMKTFRNFKELLFIIVKRRQGGIYNRYILNRAVLRAVI